MHSAKYSPREQDSVTLDPGTLVIGTFTQTCYAHTKTTMPTKINKRNIEILSPIGSYESLSAAIKAGANSIYFGIGSLNMRARAANNFTLKDIRKISKICKSHNVRSYLTLNTIMYDNDLKTVRDICNTAKKSGIDAVIASDISAIRYAYSINLEAHISTQANISNIESVKFYSRYADVMVLARELSLRQIKSICQQIRKENICGPGGNLVRIEVFVHGALCVSISGRCYMSLATYNFSANRGKCLQPCRRSYRVIDEETGKELVINNRYVMSPKDLCTIGNIDKLLDAGISILKIEGRARKADYVYATTKVYREAVDSYYNNQYTRYKIKGWLKELKAVYNRGFWHGGYYLGKKSEEWSGLYGSKSTKEKIYIGKAKNYFNKVNIAEFVLEAKKIRLGDEIIITGPTTGIIKSKADSIFLNDKPVKSAAKGKIITIPIQEKVRRNDKLYLLKTRK